MLKSEWQDAVKCVWLPEDQLEKISVPAEKHLVGKYKLAYLKGKGKKYVPVLVPIDLVDAINILYKDRDEFSVKEDNIFLFATKNGFSHCSGWHAVSDVCKMAGVNIHVNATKMRHRLSTMFASLDMTAKQQRIFFDYMGHELNINKENYQCPQGIRAVCVMGKMLGSSNSDNQDSSQAIQSQNLSDAENENISDDDFTQERKSLRNVVKRRAPLEQKSFTVTSQDIERQNLSDAENKNIPDYVFTQERKIQGNVAQGKAPKQKSFTVKWMPSDTEDLRVEFREYIFSDRDQKNNKGALPSKERIMKYLEDKQPETVAALPVQEQYLKTRAKLFNERKTVRNNINRSLENMSKK